MLTMQDDYRGALARTASLCRSAAFERGRTFPLSASLLRLVRCLGVALLDPVSVVELVIFNAGIRLIRIIRLEAERFHGCRPLTPVLTGDVVVLGLAVALFRLLLRL